MANLLPTKELSSLTRERRRRLRAAVLVLLCGVCVFGTILLIPSAIVLIAARTSAENRLATTRKLVDLQKHSDAGADIAATKEKMDVLAANSATVLPSELLSRIVPLLPSTVALHHLSFTKESTGSTVELSGTAANRAGLLTFGDVLKGSGLFVDVVIPIESLAQSTNLQFRLVLKLAERTS